MTGNQQWLLARTPPEGWPTADDFTWHTAELPVLKSGQALTRTIYLSMDPYQWGRRRSGTEQPGEVCHGRTVSEVVDSRHPEYQIGDLLFNTNGWQEYGLTGEGVSVFGYMLPRKLDPGLAPVSTAIGVLGMLGLTAWSGMWLQCQPKAGETAVISAASGGVGQIAGQIARIKGCRVVGIAGDNHKCDFVKDVLGFDACVSYKAPDFHAQLKAACPDGIDIYFENVGGAVYEAVLPLLNTQSRISLCGMISQYGNTDGGDAAATWRQTGEPYFRRQQVEVHKLFVGNFVEQYQMAFLEQMSEWVRNGEIRYKEDLWSGLEKAPEAFSAMLAGGNFGKTLVHVGDDPTLTNAIRQQRQSENVLGQH